MTKPSSIINISLLRLSSKIITIITNVGNIKVMSDQINFITNNTKKDLIFVINTHR